MIKSSELPPAAESTSAATPAAATPATSISSSQNQPADLTAFVDSLLLELQTKFDDMSAQILGKMDKMHEKIHDLEKSIGDVVGTAENTTGNGDVVIEEAQGAK